jgi:hypothetical protein
MGFYGCLANDWFGYKHGRQSFEYPLFYGSLNFARKCGCVGLGGKSATGLGLNAAHIGNVGD